MNTPLASSHDIVIDLPYPPSINRIWRSSAVIKSGSQKVYLAPTYKAWKSEADALLMTQRGWTLRSFVGPFSLDLALCPPKGQPRGDLDNRIKAVLDFLQRVSIVSNDKHCQLICAYWVESGQAPHGARVTVKPWGTQNQPLHLELILERFARTAEPITS